MEYEPALGSISRSVLFWPRLNKTACRPTGLVGVVLARQAQRDGSHGALGALWPVDCMGRQVCARSSLGRKERRNKEHIPRSGRCVAENKASRHVDGLSR